MNSTTHNRPKLRAKEIYYKEKKRLNDTDHAEWYHIGHYEAISEQTGDRYEMHITLSVAKDVWGPKGHHYALNKLTEEGYKPVSLWDLPGYSECIGNPDGDKILEMLANSIGHELELEPEN